MASANMVSAAAPTVKVALGQTAAVSGNRSLGKSSFSGASIPVCSRPSRRSERRATCISASKDESNKVVAPLRKGLAAGLLAATIATSGPANADIIPVPVEQRWGNIVQKAEKASKKVTKQFAPAVDSLNKKNVLAESQQEKIPQRSKPSFGSKSNDGLKRQNVSFDFVQAPPLTYVGLDTKGTPADPETVKDDLVGGVTDPASIPGRIQERASTIASKLPSIPSIGGGNSSTKGTPADPQTVKDDAIGGVTDPASIPGRIKQRAGTVASKLPNLPKASDVLPGDKGLKDVAPDLVEGSSQKIPQRGRPSYGSQNSGLSRTNVDFTSAPTLQYVLDTKGTPADPETVKDDAIGGVTDPASIPGRIKERAGTIADKVGEVFKGGNADKAIPGDKGLKDIAPDLVEGSSEKIQQKSGGVSASGPRSGKNVNFDFGVPLRYVLDTKGTPADPETVKDDAIGGVTDPASIPGRIKERADTIASKLPSLPGFGSGNSDTKGTPADPETVKDDAIGGVTDPASIPGRIKERASTVASKLPDLPGGGNSSTKGTPADPETVKDDAIGGVTDPASIPGRIKERAGTIASKVGGAFKGGNADQAIPGDKGVKDLAPDLVEGSSEKIPQRVAGAAKNARGVSFESAPALQFVDFNSKGVPLFKPTDPETVKSAIGGDSDLGSSSGGIKESAGNIASKIGGAFKGGNADQAIPGDKGLKDLAPDLIEGSSEKLPQRVEGAAKSARGVSFESAPALQFVDFNSKGVPLFKPADPETVKNAISGDSDLGSSSGGIKESAGNIASKIGGAFKGGNADQAIPGDKSLKDLAPDLVEGSSEKLPQRVEGAAKSARGVSFESAPALQFVGLNTKGTPADPETVKDDAIGGITDPASIPGRIKERANTIASKLPDLPSIDGALPSGKGLKDVAPDIVEGSSEKIQQRSAPSYGSQGPDLNRTNTAFSAAPTLQYVLDTKGTPADPETVKDDAIGGVTDPASIPGRIKERAGTIASKLPDLPNLPNVGDALPGGKGLEDVAPDLVEGSSEKIQQRSAPSYGSQGPEFNRTNTSFSSAATLQYIGFDTKGTPADPATVKDDAIGGVTDPASIPGRIKERAGTIASKLPDLPSIDGALPSGKGLKDVAPDIVEGSSEKVQQRSAPSYGSQGPDFNRTNTAFSDAPRLQYVLDTKGTPADPETVKDDAIGGVTDPASIPGRIKERASTIASKVGEALPNLNADKAVPGNKGVKDIAPDLVEGSSEKIQQRSAQK